MREFRAVLMGASMAMAVGTAGWAAESASAPAASSAPTAKSASPSGVMASEVIVGTIAAIDLKHPVTPTITVRRPNGKLAKVRVDVNFTSVSEGQASSQLGMLSRVRIDQRVTVTATPKGGILVAGLIKINPPLPAASSRSVR